MGYRTTSPPYGLAYIIDQIARATAGTEKHLLDLIPRLGKTLFRPHLLVLRPSEHTKKQEIPCPLHVLHLQKLAHPHSIKRGLQLYAFLRQNCISIAHIFFNDSCIFAPPFCKMAGTKVILSRRDLGFNYTSQQLFFLRLNRLFTDKVIVNSRAVRDVVCVSEGWSSPENVKIIYNGVDLCNFPNGLHGTLRQTAKIAPRAPIVGIVANLNPWKRHNDLIDAFSIVHNINSQAHLVIVGDGVLKEALRARVKSLGLMHAVHFTGEIRNPIPIIKDFSVAVLCSKTEGFSNSLLEYMASSIPVVATTAGGNVEVIEDGKNGFLVPVGNPKAIADRILRLLDHPALMHKFKRAARRTVENQFTIERMLMEHLQVYSELIERRR